MTGAWFYGTRLEIVRSWPFREENARTVPAQEEQPQTQSCSEPRSTRLAPAGVRSVSAVSQMFSHPELFGEISTYALHEILNTRGGESFTRFRTRSQQGSAWAGIPMLRSHTLQTRSGRWRQSPSLTSAIVKGSPSSELDRPILQHPAKRSASLRI